MIAKGQLINDRYEILKLIGEGGMANVYLARDTILDRRVAVKVLRGDLAGDEKFVRRFQREALSASSLSHPNIVEIYDVGEDDGNFYIVMEYIEGKTLKQLIKKRGVLSLPETMDIMLQLLDALKSAHDSYIIHRDIKPQNIMISKDGNELPGYLTLWKVSAKNSYETKLAYTAQFIADNGKVYAPYGNDIWNRLVQNKSDFVCTGERISKIVLDDNNQLQNNLQAIFHRMEMDIDSNIRNMSEKKLRALQYAEQRINKIGIANIRNARLKKLNLEKVRWEKTFSKGKSVVPNVSMILIVRLNG